MQIRGLPIKKHFLEKLSLDPELAKLKFLLVGNPNQQESNYYLDSVKKTLRSLNISFAELASDQSQVIAKEIRCSEDFTSIIVARPLGLLEEEKLIELIPPLKDADMLTTYSAGRLLRGDLNYLPATAQAVKTLIESRNFDLSGKKALVIGRSPSVGTPIFWCLSKMNATVTLAHSRTPLDDLRRLAKESDLVVTACGQKLLRPEDIKSGSLIIDCGYDSSGCGDLPFEPTNADYTPVPGGVGPLTVVCLISNALFLYKQSKIY